MGKKLENILKSELLKKTLTILVFTTAGAVLQKIRLGEYTTKLNMLVGALAGTATGITIYGFSKIQDYIYKDRESIDEEEKNL